MIYSGHPDQKFGHVTYSQHGEDLMIVNIFSLIGIERGTYLDLGAHHPVNISNTKLLYDRGWRGVNVEANPNLIAEFIRERPYDLNVCIGVGSRNGTATFFMHDELSGRNTFSFREANEVNAEHGLEYLTTKTLRLESFNTIRQKYFGMAMPDFISCDVEGLDYEVLKAAELNFKPPAVICVEIRPTAIPAFNHMMLLKGYYSHCRMGENSIYVHHVHRNKANGLI